MSGSIELSSIYKKIYNDVSCEITKAGPRILKQARILQDQDERTSESARGVLRTSEGLSEDEHAYDKLVIDLQYTFVNCNEALYRAWFNASDIEEHRFCLAIEVVVIAIIVGIIAISSLSTIPFVGLAIMCVIAASNLRKTRNFFKLYNENIRAIVRQATRKILIEWREARKEQNLEISDPQSLGYLWIQKQIAQVCLLQNIQKLCSSEKRP